MLPQATTLLAVPTVPLPAAILLLAETAPVQLAQPTVPRVVQQTRVQAMLAAVLVVSVRVVSARVAPRLAAPPRTPIRVVPVGPRIAEPAAVVGTAVRAALPPELVGMPIAEPAGMPIVEPVVPRTAVPAVTRLVDPQVAGIAVAAPVVRVLEALLRAMQVAIPTAVLVVPRTADLVGRVLVVRRPPPRLRAVQDLLAVPRTAVPAVQRLAVTAVPAEQGQVVSVLRVRAVRPLVAQVLPAVLETLVQVVPRTPEPAVQLQPVPVVLVVTRLAVIPTLPAVM